MADTSELTDIVRRGPMLRVLRGGPKDRRDLEVELDVSKPTVHRATKTLMGYGLVRRTDGSFELTSAGETVAETFDQFEETTSATLRLAPFLETVEGAAFGVDVEGFADATVTRPANGDPYRPVTRFMSLVTETDTLRGFDTSTVAPANVDRIYQRIVDGMRTEIIYPPDVVATIVENNPDRGMEAVESGNLTLLTHEDVPCGLAIFDDRVGLGGYDPQTGMLDVFVDTDSPEARAWAEATFEEFRAEAQQLTGF